MISFRDMTFCPFNLDCQHAEGCHRALTPEVENAAADWWGNDEPPIARFIDKPECHEPVNEARP